jgi:hypothetical protein
MLRYVLRASATQHDHSGWPAVFISSANKDNQTPGLPGCCKIISPLAVYPEADLHPERAASDAVG